MKSRLALFIVLFCVLVGATVFSYMQYTTALASQSFTLTATGRAYDRSHHKYVDVQLSVRGTDHGKWKTVIELYVTGGDLQVEYYGTFSVSRGFGVLIQGHHCILLVIKITSRYGGKTAVWILRGKTGTLRGNTLSVNFCSSRVILPGGFRLYDLSLKGTMTLN